MCERKLTLFFSQGCYCWNVPRVFPGEWNNLTPLVMACRYHRQTWKDLTEEHPDMLENAKNMQAIHLAFVTYACQGQRRETGKIWYSSICVCPNIDFMLVYVTDVNMSKYHGKYSSVLCFPQFVIFWRLAILLLIGNTHPQKESSRTNLFCGVYFWHTLRNVARGLIRHARVFETPAPWDTTPPWTQLLHDESVGGEQRFHRIDIWHTFHMGFGKNWISCCVARIQYLTLGTSVDKRVEILNQDFQDYCTANKKTKYISKLEPSTFGLKFAEPSGSWNKAHVTSTLMGWLESFLGKYPTECENDEEIRFIVASKYFLNTFLWFVMCNHFFSSAVFF